MIRLRALLLLVATATATSPARTNAQTATDLVMQGIRAYDELEYEAAAASLRRALRTEPGSEFAREDYARALIYLAATVYYQGDPDSTDALFRQLVLFDTRQRPDPLVFEPGLTDIFEAVRREVKAITVLVPPRTVIQGRSAQLPVAIYASSFIGTVVEVFDEDSALVRLVYDGPVSDSLVVRWDGLDSTGVPLADGNYTLAATSRRPGGVALRSTRFPLSLMTIRRDTLAHPLPLADSLFLPERVGTGRGVETLLGGLLMGGAVLFLPNALASEAELAGARFVVGSAMSLAGIVGFATKRPGRLLVENVAANNALTESWNERVDSVIAENADRVAQTRLVIETGEPRIVDLRRR